MEAVRTSETSVDNYFARQYIPEDNSELLNSSLVLCVEKMQRNINSVFMSRHQNAVIKSQYC
jgi:hypothetical protein